VTADAVLFESDPRVRAGAFRSQGHECLRLVCAGVTILTSDVLMFSAERPAGVSVVKRITVLPGPFNQFEVETAVIGVAGCTLARAVIGMIASVILFKKLDSGVTIKAVLVDAFLTHAMTLEAVTGAFQAGMRFGKIPGGDLRGNTRAIERDDADDRDKHE
jgi:hypothetical protein